MFENRMLRTLYRQLKYQIDEGYCVTKDPLDEILAGRQREKCRRGDFGIREILLLYLDWTDLWVVFVSSYGQMSGHCMTENDNFLPQVFRFAVH
jgi:hypothetical protein